MSLNKEKIYYLGIVLLISLFFIFLPDKAGAIPATFSLQGRVLDQTGQEVADGYYPMVFRIYTSFYGGSPIWTEERSNTTELVPVENSLFSVTLGTYQSLSEINFSSGNFYLSIEFNNDGEMSPRKKLSSVPFSLYTTSLNDKISTDFVLKRGDTLLGNLNLDKHNLTTTGQVVGGQVVGGQFLQGVTPLEDIYLKLTGGSIAGDLTLTGKLTAGKGLTVSSGEIKLPNASIASTALPTNTSFLGQTIESSEITDKTIANADISDTAAIAYSKLNIADNDLTIAKTSGLQTALNSKLNLSGGTLTGTLNVSGVSGLTDTDIPNDLTITSTKKIQTTLTSEQLRLNYDADHYASFSVDSSGSLIIEPVPGNIFLYGGTDTTNLALAGANVDLSRGINISRSINSGYYYGLYNDLTKYGPDTGAVYGVYNKMRDDRSAGVNCGGKNQPPCVGDTAYGLFNDLTTATSGTAYGVYTQTNANTSTGTIYAYVSDLTAGSPTDKWNLALRGAPNYLTFGGGLPQSNSSTAPLLTLDSGTSNNDILQVLDDGGTVFAIKDNGAIRSTAVGEGWILGGDSEVIIDDTRVTNDSVILLTISPSYGLTGSNSLKIKAINQGVSFTVSTVDGSDVSSSTHFVYLIIN